MLPNNFLFTNTVPPLALYKSERVNIEILHA